MAVGDVLDSSFPSLRAQAKQSAFVKRGVSLDRFALGSR